MDLSMLQYYVAVCELSSITKAANKLYISRQAISKSISNLENTLDAQLITVRRDGIELTDEGRCMYKNAQKMINVWNTAMEEIESIKRARRKTINVGYGQMTYNLWDINHIEKFKTQNPDIDILVDIMLPDQLLAGLSDRHLDVAITSTEGNDKCFSATTIKRLTLYAMMCADDYLASISHITPKDLTGRNMYFIPNNQTFFNGFNKFILNEQIEANCQYCIDSNLLTIMKTVKQNKGIYLTSGIFNSLISFPKEFVMKPFIYNGPNIMPNKNIQAITLRDASNNTDVKRYVDYLQTNIINYRNIIAN